jgi:hypothetical protein
MLRFVLTQAGFVVVLDHQLTILLLESVRHSLAQ